MIAVHITPISPTQSTIKPTIAEDVRPAQKVRMDRLLGEVQELFKQQSKVESLLALSKKLQTEFKERLQSSSQCMLPSHNYTLPNGKEQGTYLALEVGGSTLRVALVDLDGRSSSRQPLRIRRIVTSTIDNRVRDLRGLAFFDWIAAKVEEMLSADKEALDHTQLKEPLPMGIAWSFPIESVFQLSTHPPRLTAALAKRRYEVGISLEWEKVSTAPYTRVTTLVI